MASSQLAWVIVALSSLRQNVSKLKTALPTQTKFIKSISNSQVRSKTKIRTMTFIKVALTRFKLTLSSS